MAKRRNNGEGAKKGIGRGGRKCKMGGKREARRGQAKARGKIEGG